MSGNNTQTEVREMIDVFPRNPYVCILPCV